ncbi:zinc ribbon domain-containing protein [Nocardia sp. NPDC050718]|uniref:zinc ribbon domain-containing protein n=1 Tax=Nocardia sp. NPDC050718 TaxID=3155788 RepID=UPI0033EB80CA
MVASEAERTRATVPGYLLAGRVRCDLCGRRMQGETIREHPFYRCRAKTLTRGSGVLATHPRTVSLLEDHLIAPVDTWIVGLFDRRHREKTIAALVAAQPHDDDDTRRASMRQRVTNVELPEISPVCRVIWSSCIRGPR